MRRNRSRWLLTALLICAISGSACARHSALVAVPIPARPVMEPLPEAPPIQGREGCLKETALAQARSPCADDASAVFVMERAAAARLAVWMRDVRDAWARMQLRVEDYVERAESRFRAVNEAVGGRWSPPRSNP